MKKFIAVLLLLFTASDAYGGKFFIFQVSTEQDKRRDEFNQLGDRSLVMAIRTSKLESSFVKSHHSRKLIESVVGKSNVEMVSRTTHARPMSGRLCVALRLKRDDLPIKSRFYSKPKLGGILVFYSNKNQVASGAIVFLRSDGKNRSLKAQIAWENEKLEEIRKWLRVEPKNLEVKPDELKAWKFARDQVARIFR